MSSEIVKWFNKCEDNTTYNNFNVIFFRENDSSFPDESIKFFLEEQLAISYRNISFLKRNYSEEPQQKLIDYLNNYVFPTMSNQINKNVWKGDFGEILAGLIVGYFQNLEIPIKKMKLKFNSNRSVFSTDMIAHNTGDEITDIYYYEIKTRQNIKQKETVNQSYDYITVHAHNSLFRDEQLPNEGIADFISRFYEEQATQYGENDNNEMMNQMLEKSKKYHDIVKNPSNYNRNFELFFITEKSSYENVVLHALNTQTTHLTPLNVTIVLIENLNHLINTSRDNVIQSTVRLVHDVQ
uniref:Hachiman antiphage defense system protein HamA n=1 Tax=Aliarcobacter sp. TaxID=2321116 RepID=UPI0040489FA3